MATSLRVRLQPRASRDEIVGERDGSLVIRVTAPPVEGEANAALCRLIAKRVGVGRTAVSVVRGRRSRDKLIEVDGPGDAAVRRALGLDADR